MSAEIHALAGVTVGGERKPHMVQFMAEAIDRYVEDFGEEPECAVLVLCGLKQTARVSYAIKGASIGGTTSIMALAQASLLNQIISPDE